MLRAYFKILIIIILFFSCSKDENDTINKLNIVSVKIGTIYLKETDTIKNIPINNKIIISFKSSVDTNTISKNIYILKDRKTNIPFIINYMEDYKAIIISPKSNLLGNSLYYLQIGSGIFGKNKEPFEGKDYNFITTNYDIKLNTIVLNGNDFSSLPIKNIDHKSIVIEMSFSDTLSTESLSSNFSLTSGNPLSVSLLEDKKKVRITNVSRLNPLTRYYFQTSNNLTSIKGAIFSGFSNSFITGIDTSQKFPTISDEELLTKVQQQSFKFFWDYAHATSGLARERNGSGDLVTIGGSGFGVMAILVGIERGFISKSDGLARLLKITNFLKNTAERFHGVFPHWLNGNTGKTIAFSSKDNGADLVESAFLFQGLLTIREYCKNGTSQDEIDLCSNITNLWESVEWDWFRKNGENKLYWHWSPNYNWDMNMPIRGWNEGLIVYVLAASSPTHTIPKEVYTEGWTNNGSIKNGQSYYNINLPLGESFGGPLFFTHYSFLGLDPRNLSDANANYWTQNVNHSKINYLYCKNNPKNNYGYSDKCWGLTASDIQNGYTASSPNNDVGVIAPTAALSSMPYTPAESLQALRYFYYILGDKLWGEYGFYDSFKLSTPWFASSYLAIDQGPIICMIENHRSGLLWKYFMQNEEIKTGLTKLGFSY